MMPMNGFQPTQWTPANQSQNVTFKIPKRAKAIKNNDGSTTIVQQQKPSLMQRVKSFFTGKSSKSAEKKTEIPANEANKSETTGNKLDWTIDDYQRDVINNPEKYGMKPGDKVTIGKQQGMTQNMSQMDVPQDPFQAIMSQLQNMMGFGGQTTMTTQVQQPMDPYMTMMMQMRDQQMQMFTALMASMFPQMQQNQPPQTDNGELKTQDANTQKFTERKEEYTKLCKRFVNLEAQTPEIGSSLKGIKELLKTKDPDKLGNIDNLLSEVKSKIKAQRKFEKKQEARV